MNTEKLENGKHYHIYNHGVGGRELFREPDHYEHFLSLYEKYISPVAETYAWVLMPNHFHLLVRIKENVVYKYSNADGSVDAVTFDEIKWKTIEIPANPTASERPVGVSVKKVEPSRHFSHLFNAYSKYMNKRYGTRGALFERPFKRKLIDSEEYLRKVIVYIHRNPVHHGFCSHPLEYGWSSYITNTSGKITTMNHKEVVSWFEDRQRFELAHNNTLNMDQMDSEMGCDNKPDRNKGLKNYN
jgi:putative transposase